MHASVLNQVWLKKRWSYIFKISYLNLGSWLTHPPLKGGVLQTQIGLGVCSVSVLTNY